MEINNSQRYPWFYALLHSLIAVLIMTLFLMQYVRRLFGDDMHAIVREWHKTIGLILLILVIIRLAIRLRTALPAAFDDGAYFRIFFASAVHFFLWALMIVVPMTGVFFLLARGRGVSLFNVWTISPLTEGSAVQGELVLELHRFAAWGLVILALVHILAAIYHHFILHDTLLSRMSIFRKR
ncbi:cytochrome b/b6 domain-containing protein [Raoultella sp. BAC10a-01-01]|uniref:Cytochrome b/b6 domain-containing protein n=1 Tax=Raoultella scottii TaxID=3040937 RepID=A0ABU8YZQ9_9ENTR